MIYDLILMKFIKTVCSFRKFCDRPREREWSWVNVAHILLNKKFMSVSDRGSLFFGSDCEWSSSRKKWTCPSLSKSNMMFGQPDLSFITTKYFGYYHYYFGCYYFGITTFFNTLLVNPKITIRHIDHLLMLRKTDNWEL